MFKITKKPRGWIVEYQTYKFNFLGFRFYKVWRPYVKSAGLDCCWHHSSYKYAEDNMLTQIKKDCYELSHGL